MGVRKAWWQKQWDCKKHPWCKRRAVSTHTFIRMRKFHSENTQKPLLGEWGELRNRIATKWKGGFRGHTKSLSPEKGRALTENVWKNRWVPCKDIIESYKTCVINLDCKKGCTEQSVSFLLISILFPFLFFFHLVIGRKFWKWGEMKTSSDLRSSLWRFFDAFGDHTF